MKKSLYSFLLTILSTLFLFGKSNNLMIEELKENISITSSDNFPTRFHNIFEHTDFLFGESVFSGTYLNIEGGVIGSNHNEDIKEEAISELLEFTAILNSDRVEIKWIYGKEINHENFVIEKSKDGKKFTTMINVSHIENTSEYTEYFETDYKPSLFYRLKQKTNDHNGYKYSEVVYAKPNITKCPGFDSISELKNADILEHHNRESLIVVRDKNGNEFSSKVVFSIEDSGIIAVDPSNVIPPGDYLIVASKVKSIDKQRVEIK